MARRSLILLLLPLVLAGCGGTGGGAGRADGGPITFQLAGDPEETGVHREVVRRYRERSGAQVELVELGDKSEHLARLSTSFAARRPPDVFLVNHRDMASFAARGVLAPVGEWFEEEDAFVPVALDAFRFEGTLQCLPTNSSSLVVYVNRELVPEGPRDFADLVRIARGLGRRGVGIEPALIRAAPFVWSAGGELVDDPDAPTRFTLGSPQARRGLEAMRELAAFGPTFEEARSKGLGDRFADGELAMWMSSRREVPGLRTAARDVRWDVVGFPRLREPATVLHSDGYCIARGGDTAAARRYVEFASSAEGQAILARSGRTVPSRRSVASSEDFLGSTPPRSNDVFLDAVGPGGGMRRLPTIPGWEKIEEAADLALEGFFYGRTSLDEALGRIERETQGAF